MFNHMDFMDVNLYSSLSLAYLGDAVYDLYIRSKLMTKGNRSVNDLHKTTSGLVRAKAQSALYEQIKDLLTPEEVAVYKRGRNARSNTSPKNTEMIDYRRATGLEALIGYLYILRQYDRIDQLLQISFRHHH